ncbi:MAG: GntR family transcriptional regulator [Firmicutes bacterium]|nr:GntR family transcriptional regulator [Bacillota bacterium]
MNKTNGEFEQDYSPLSDYRGAVNEKNPMPLYAQVEAVLEHLISTGNIPNDGSFFTEEEIARELRVSRPTVRTAMDSLVASGYIMKQRGKKAKVICQPPVELFYMGELLSFGEMLTRLGRNYSTRLIERGIMKPPVSVARAMHISKSDLVVHLRRLRHVDSNPLIVVDSYLPASEFSQLMDIDKAIFASTDLYALLRDMYGVRIGCAERTVSASRVNIQDVELLKIPLWEPCLRLQGVAFDTDDKAVEYFDSRLRGDRVVLKSSLKAESKT